MRDQAMWLAIFALVLPSLAKAGTPAKLVPPGFYQIITQTYCQQSSFSTDCPDSMTEVTAAVSMYCHLTEPLSVEEKAAILSYTTNMYQPLNLALRKQDSTFAPFVKVLDSALAKLPDYVGNVTRHDSIPAEIVDKWHVGDLIKTRAYMSTMAPGGGFSGNYTQIFHILAVHGKKISDCSAEPSENEVLFRPGTEFRILKIYKDDADILNIDAVEIDLSHLSKALNKYVKFKPD